MSDQVEIENSRILRLISEQASEFLGSDVQSLSYDSIANQILKSVNWSLKADYDQNIEYFFSKERYLRRTYYYYNQFLKAMVNEDQIDLTANEYLDFWKCVSSISAVSSLNTYQKKVILKKDYFPFLRAFRIFVEDAKYKINFKIKVLKVLKLKANVERGQ